MRDHKKERGMYWKCNIPSFFSEVVNGHPSPGPLPGGFKVLSSILGELADVALEIDDPRLHLMMCRLSLYSIADQYSGDYDSDIFKNLEDEIEKMNK
jgi:hypothetical protein